MFGGKDKKRDKDDDKHKKDKDDDKHKKDKDEKPKDKDTSSSRRDDRISREVRDFESPKKTPDTPAPVVNPAVAVDKAKEEEEVKKKADDEARRAQAKKEEDEKKKEEEKKKRDDEKKDEDRRRRREEDKARKLKEEEAEKQKAAAAAAAAASKKDDKKEEEINDEVEIQSLEAVKTDPSESKTIYREVYELFPAEVYTSYDKLQDFARDLNTLIPVLEIAIVGPKGSGKSSIIEAILGRPVNVIGSGASKRPLFFQLINNLEFEQPRVTIKRDTVLAEFDHDVVVPLDSLPEAIASREKDLSEEPIFVNYEYKYCLNMTLIDTPGLRKAGEAGEKEVENIVLNIIRSSHRLILAVEVSRDGAVAELPTFVKRADPELSRSTFVYTKFFSQLQDFNNTRAVNRFLSGTLPDVKTFFTTLPSGKVRGRFRETEKFQEKVWQAYRRDMNYLEQLQYDKRYERNIGVHALRRYLLNLAWRSYQESIPRILKHLRTKRHVTEQRLKEVQAQLSGLDSSKLRSLASNYVVNFLQIVEQLIEGTSEGNPSVNGQTLDEEKSQQGDGDWVDIYNRPVKFEAEDWGIPYWESKLYGGQQFERLLAEFKAVSDHTEISEVTMDDVATAAGINKLNNVPNYAWAASDLAQQKSQDALVPLIEQLCERAVYIIRRLTDVAEKVIDSRKKKWQASYRGVDITNIEQYPYFTHHVKDLFYKYVDETAKVCKVKCMDEFLSTRTIYWDLTEYPEHNIPIDRNDHEDTRTTVVQLAKQLFTTLRQRITKNVLLKFYNFFLVPIQIDLWNEIQGKITSLSDQQLEQIFEVSATKDKFREDEKLLQNVLKKTVEQDQLFLDASTHFCHPIVLNQLNAGNDS